ITHPFEAVQFVLAFLGHPLSWTDAIWPNVVIGLVGVLLFVGFIAALRGAALPWALIGSYAIISACATALGRLGFGDWAALEPRYTSFALALWVANVMLAAMCLTSLRALSAFALLILHVLAAYSVWPKIRESNRD